MWALNRTEDDEDDSDIIVSTAHKAKGREWSKVRLMDDFLKSQARRQNQAEKHEATDGHDPAELRLFYVALTRAREEIEVAPNVLPLIGLSPASYASGSRNEPQKPTSAAHPNGAARAGVKPTRPSQQQAVWTPPSNWNPPTKPQPTLTAPPRQGQLQKPKKKGLLGWLFGK